MSPGEVPVLGDDPLAGQQARHHRRVDVWVDEARQDHRVGEAIVDDMFVAGEPRLQRLERADLDNAAVAHRNGSGLGQRRVHRVDPGCGEDGDHGRVLTGG